MKAWGVNNGTIGCFKLFGFHFYYMLRRLLRASIHRMDIFIVWRILHRMLI